MVANGGSNAGYWDWKVDEDVNGGYPFLSEWTLEVTLDSNDGTTSTLTVPQTHGEKYLLPIFDPERDGYQFKGWYTAASGGAEVTPATTVATTADHTLWAQWLQAVTHTTNTPVQVPYTWLDQWENDIADYEAFAESKGANGIPRWESYVAGLIPTNASSRFLITNFVMNGTAITALDWTPNYETTPDPWTGKLRIYEVLGKTNLTDEAWHSPTNSGSRFFRVNVSMPKK